MKFLSLEPFIPSGKNFDISKQLFVALGFSITWDAGDYIGYERDGCRFILQKYHNDEFAQNLMLNIRIDDVKAFREHVIQNQLPEKFGIRVGEITNMPYGKEVNIIDNAGVCWHFVE
jgi:hypothetical protein